MRDFNYPDICWKWDIVEKQSRRFLKCADDNFQMQVAREPTREGATLDLFFVNREVLMTDVMFGGCLRHGDHIMIDFSTLGEARRAVSRTATLHFLWADFGLFRDLFDRVPWEAVLKGKAFQEGWTLFKNEVLKAQEQAVSMCQNMNCE